MAGTYGRIVVLGAGYAGLSCAFRLATRLPEARITVVDARDTFCERVRLHQVAVGQSTRRPRLQPWLAQSGIGFEQARVLGVDCQERCVLTSHGDMSYDHLVFALGSDVVSEVPGVALHTCSVASEASALELCARLQRLSSGCRVVVVGGGLTGIELAAEVAEARPDLVVELVGREELGLGLLARSAQRQLRHVFTKLGVQVREGLTVTRVEAGSLVCSSMKIGFDVCVWTTGFVAPRLANEAGLPTGRAGRIEVDRTLRVPGYPNIYAIGDAGEPIEAVGAPVLMSCRLGMPAGFHAAENLARELTGGAPEAWRVRDMLRCLSLGRSSGLVQLHREDGRLIDWSLSGRAAAWLKENICRGTLWVLEREAGHARSARGLRSVASSPMAYVS